jgi:hypothetical protein
LSAGLRDDSPFWKNGASRFSRNGPCRIHPRGVFSRRQPGRLRPSPEKNLDSALAGERNASGSATGFRLEFYPSDYPMEPPTPSFKVHRERCSQGDFTASPPLTSEDTNASGPGRMSAACAGTSSTGRCYVLLRSTWGSPCNADEHAANPGGMSASPSPALKRRGIIAPPHPLFSLSQPRDRSDRQRSGLEPSLDFL